jgi:uncharacterized membrane protein
MLRGLVMVTMAVDHARDFADSAAMNFPPEDWRVPPRRSS